MAFPESRKSSRARTAEGTARSPLPRLKGLSLCEVEWAQLCLSPRTFSRGEEVRNHLPFPLSPEPTKAEMELSIACARGEPVSPELMHEAEGDVWIRCRQVVVLAWSSLLHAKQCVCAQVCSWRNGCMPTLSRKSPKSFVRTILWNLAYPEKISTMESIVHEHPIRSETNGIAERVVRRTKEGTSAVLLQYGLDETWWADSVECCCYLRSVQDLLEDGKTPYERRFGEPLKGLVIPFGSMVEYHSISAKHQSRLHQSGKKVLLVRCLGYALYAGEEFGQETCWSQTPRSLKFWTRQKSMLEG